MTRSEGIDIDISCTTASLLLSSSMFNTRNVLRRSPSRCVVSSSYDKVREGYIKNTVKI